MEQIKPEERGLLELLHFSYNWIGMCGCANSRDGIPPELESWLDRCGKAVDFYKEAYGISFGSEGKVTWKQEPTSKQEPAGVG